MSDKHAADAGEQKSVPGSNYEAIHSRRAEFVERQKNGLIVVKEGDNESQISRQGHLKNYLGHSAATVLNDDEWSVFVHDVKKQSGKHRHQGGLVLYVIEGEGSTEVNGELIDWEEGDLVLLPLVPGGVEHVHFNRGTSSAKWLAFIYQPIFQHVATQLTQSSVMPEFQQKFGGG